MLRKVPEGQTLQQLSEWLSSKQLPRNRSFYAQIKILPGLIFIFTATNDVWQN